MNCPKCNFEQLETNSECESCGVIFTRYYSWLESKSAKAKSGPGQSTTEDGSSSASITQLFFYSKPEENVIYVYGRLGVFIILVFWGGRFILSPIESNYAGQSFMHLINLPFHEAGHVLLRPFGSFLSSLGGTLGQLLMPLVCFVVLLIKTRDTFGASVSLWWFGQNFFDIAPYINDARSLNLPLLGGNVGHSSPYGFHDWEYLLTETGLLKYDHLLANLCVITGTIVFVLSYLWGAALLFKQYQER